jgi:cation diffusion facilitator CzcD-associated flavoprotein CzcO
MAQQPLDLLVVGAGIAGVVHLHYARRAGLDALVLDGHDQAGGLWARLPAWQDIQIGLADWAMQGLPLAAPEQPHVLANIQAWVDRFALADGIRLRTPVRQGAPAAGRAVPARRTRWSPGAAGCSAAWMRRTSTCPA